MTFSTQMDRLRAAKMMCDNAPTRETKSSTRAFLREVVADVLDSYDQLVSTDFYDSALDTAVERSQGVRR